MDLLEALDLQSPTWHDDLGGAWDTLIEECLWPVLADRAEQQRVAEGLTKGRAWILLSWADDASNLAARRGWRALCGLTGTHDTAAPEFLFRGGER